MKSRDGIIGSLFAKASVAGVTACVAACAFGAGLSLYEGSARGVVDAAGVTAKGGEPGAMFHNGAGIAGLEGDQVQFGITFVAPSASIQGTSPYTGKYYKEDGKSKVWPLPHFYYTHQINDSWWLGFSEYSRVGLGSNFKNGWFGRYNSCEGTILSASYGPTLTWKANDWLVLSAGFTANFIEVTLGQCLDPAGAMGLRQYNDPAYSPYDIYQEFHGDDPFAMGYDLGLQLKPFEDLTLGVGYHSEVAFKCSGDARWYTPPAVKAMAPQFFNKTDMKGDITIPQIIMAAMTYDVNERLTLGAGVTWTDWSCFSDLLLRLETPEVFGKKDLASEKGWSDCWRYTAGFSYQLNDALQLRTSYTYDGSPLNDKHFDYLVPADTRHIFAVGCGWDVSDSWTIDATYFYEKIEDQVVGARVKDGIFQSQYCDGVAHALSLSATYKF